MENTQKIKTILTKNNKFLPREKLIRYNTPDSLKDEELLAIILRTGTKNHTVLDLAKKLLQHYGKELPYISVNELKNFLNIGKVRACSIVAAFELGKRFLREKKTYLYLTPKDVYERLSAYRTAKKEHFFVFYLDTKNQEIHCELISVGILNASLVHPREVFEPAIKHLAAQIIIAHNHPSGSLEPSEEDIQLTKRLIKAAEILGIELIDHIIISKEGYYSFKQNKII
ncbi:MAG: DNA repair protein RadC [Elusimicrobiota bacterium]|nr:DNA repair protein RadC [Endomicrobiia bacterium]MDW8166328.1 DNA repair protein RadC [Elusimicrobiota bacterium]